MNCRGFVTGVGAVLAVAFSPSAADAAPARKIPVIGYLAPEAESAFGGLNAFRQWLRDLGYVEGETVALETRFTNEREERARVLATELVQRGVDVIVARNTVSALAAKQATSTIPIVFTEVGDPVARGLVASIGRPGGNATGLGSFASVEVNAKRLALLVEAVPGIARVAVLRYKNPALQELARSSLDVLREAAQKLGVVLQILHVQQPADLEIAFAAMTRERAGGLLLVGAPFFVMHRAAILRLTAQHRLPTISTERPFVEARRPHCIRGVHAGHRAARRRVRRQDSQGCQARRASGRAGVQVRAGHQPQDRQGSRRHNPALAAAAGGSSARMRNRGSRQNLEGWLRRKTAAPAPKPKPARPPRHPGVPRPAPPKPR